MYFTTAVEDYRVALKNVMLASKSQVINSDLE